MSLAFWLKVAFNIFELLLYSFFLRWSFGSGLLFHAVKIAYSLPCFQFAFQLVLSGHGLDVSHVFYFTLT